MFIKHRRDGFNYESPSLPSSLFFPSFIANAKPAVNKIYSFNQLTGGDKNTSAQFQHAYGEISLKKKNSHQEQCMSVCIWGNKVFRLPQNLSPTLKK